MSINSNSRCSSLRCWDRQDCCYLKSCHQLALMSIGRSCCLNLCRYGSDEHCPWIWYQTFFHLYWRRLHLKNSLAHSYQIHYSFFKHLQFFFTAHLVISVFSPYFWTKIKLLALTRYNLGTNFQKTIHKTNKTLATWPSAPQTYTVFSRIHWYHPK